MPMFDFTCQDCEHEIELLLKRDEEPGECPECGGELEKQISRGSFILKGGGWYKDGYQKARIVKNRQE